MQLHQSLHGYRDGHQLLAASLSLNREQQTQVLVMSDLSGPAFRKGFDGYLTGYPLVGDGYYCFARTWFAEEMRRPGCVWTHTIFVGLNDLARAWDLATLLAAFRRPELGKNFDSYAAQVVVPHSADVKRAYPSIAAYVIYKLYSTTSAVFVVNDSAEDFDLLVLKVMNQQWPRLRARFRFCTGLIAPKSTAFDFAVIPPEAQRSVAPAAPAKLGDSSAEREIKWLDTAVQDVLGDSDQPSEFRRFLWSYGPDCGNSRGSFKPLVDVYLAMSSTVDPLLHTLSAVAAGFPSPQEAAHLKSELFSRRGQFSTGPNGERSVLALLLRHPGSNAIPEEVADLVARSKALFHDDPQAALELAVAAVEIGDSRGQRFVDGFVEGLRESGKPMTGLSLSLLLEVARRYLEIACYPESWKRPKQEQLTLAMHISSLPGSANLARRILVAALDARAWTSLPPLVNLHGSMALATVLEWLDRPETQTLGVSSAIREILEQHQPQIVSLLEREKFGPRAIATLCSVLDPRSSEVMALDTALWTIPSWPRIETSKTPLELRSRAFLLAIALSRSGEEGAQKLLSASYSPVYEAARADELDDKLWQWIEPHMPWYIASWDKCAQLTKAVSRLYVDHGWSPLELANTALTEDQFARLLADLDRTYSGGRVLRKICRLRKENVLVLDAGRDRILKEHCSG